ncbi:hypothetical protein [Saccharothrix syringae]|uniref:Uncharacterized protein n=1 Tax=Saccharothrix syringae TaxID=103733 RepID=A0A5Q0H2B1_SACSY|nr:hypothetical protein [Saccharothrix syringae]QFZ20348.1 hypothetical protein EKG83_25630 [Saccharothrix syringae]
MTCRTGTDLPALRRPWQALSIGAGDRSNTADLRRFLTAAAGAEPLASLLARHRVPVRALVRDLVERCGGVWVYSRYVLDEIRYGARSPAELDLLPGDLAHYYFECLSASRDEAAWSRVRLPVLGTPAAAAEPLTVDGLARLAGVTDRAAVSELCAGRLRPFLTDDGGCYGIYHTSLREFLAGMLRGHVVDGVRSRVGELAAATREAHDRIADHYLDLFGGLGTGLARLGDDPAVAGADGGYALRHLTHHLAAAGRVGEVHRVLACERATGPGTSRNLWFDAHNSRGTVDDYLADVARARRHAEADTDGRVVAGRPAPGIALEIRYALITAGVTTLTANVPVPLLLRLVTSGVWPHTRALAHARHLHVPGDRARALTGLLDHLPEPDRTTALADALAAVRAITDGVQRAEQVGALAPHLPDHLLAQAFATATAIGDEQARADAVVRLLHYLPDSFVPDVLAIARATDDRFGRAKILSWLALCLPDGLLDEALALARQISGTPNRVWALCKLAQHDASGDAVTREAVETALATEDPWERIRALLTIMSELGDGHASLLAPTLAAATGLESVPGKVIALCAIAEYLPEAEQDDVITEAIAGAATLDDEEQLADLLVRLTTDCLQGRRSDELLALARLVRDPGLRARVLRHLAAHLLAAEREQVLSEALANAAEIDEGERAHVIRLLAPLLAEAQLTRAVAEAKRMSDGFYRSHALGALAPHLPEHLVGEALSVGRVEHRRRHDRRREHAGVGARTTGHPIPAASAGRDPSRRAGRGADLASRVVSGCAPGLARRRDATARVLRGTRGGHRPGEDPRQERQFAGTGGGQARQVRSGTDADHAAGRYQRRAGRQ